jgi:branched-chain amino acid transport system ATP-binding protein
MSMLEVENLEASYGPVKVLHGISFEVGAGSTVVILGANGAGKTTTLRALTGMTRNRGRVNLEGTDITQAPTPAIVRKGVAHVPQGRGTFTDLTVVENLRLGAYVRRDKALTSDLDRCYDLFPKLGQRRDQQAGTLSGGEQQMLAIARALMLRPRLLLLDEPSLGLAPIIVQELFQALERISAEEDVSMLIVEQNANLALDIADQAYVLEAGLVVSVGPAAELKAAKNLRNAYLGY